MIVNKRVTSERRKIQRTLDMRNHIQSERVQEKQPKTRENREDNLRIYHQNVNGINSEGNEGVEEITAHLQQLKVSVHSLVETNVKWTPQESKRFVDRAKRKLRNLNGRNTQYSMQAASCKE